MKKFENSHTFASGVFPDTLPINETSPGAKDGTEWVAEGIGEPWGWMQALLNETGITPSGSVELSGAGLSDIVKGLKTLIGGEKIQPISASLAANAMTITLSPTYLDFRSATLGSGTVNNRILTAAISLVISSGSTLGTTSGVQSRIAVLAIDNSGTLELAAVNLAGGNDLSETGLITTVAEGGAGAADADNVFYSNALRSNVPYKVVGYIESTQATAGAWATSPSTIQGKGGNVNVGPKNAINIAKAWVNFNGTGVVAINDSFNISSITDNGTGDYTLNFASALNDANYAFTGGVKNDDVAYIWAVVEPLAGGRSVNALPVIVVSARSGDATIYGRDSSGVNISIFGG